MHYVHLQWNVFNIMEIYNSTRGKKNLIRTSK